MADRLADRAGRLVAAVSTTWDQAIAVLLPRCQKAAAAGRSGWERAIAFLVPRCRKAVAAARSGWERAIASLVPRYRRTVDIARTVPDRARTAGHRLRAPSGGVHRRARSADVRSRVSQLVKQRSEIDHAEYVELTDLLEQDERHRQHQ